MRTDLAGDRCVRHYRRRLLTLRSLLGFQSGYWRDALVGALWEGEQLAVAVARWRRDEEHCSCPVKLTQPPTSVTDEDESWMSPDESPIRARFAGRLCSEPMGLCPGLAVYLASYTLLGELFRKRRCTPSSFRSEVASCEEAAWTYVSGHLRESLSVLCLDPKSRGTSTQASFQIPSTSNQQPVPQLSIHSIHPSLRRRRRPP
jgi:hypothetical protein